ncbi:MAG: LppX_LprAFG lipoprotein [Cellulosilyticum sp.]|nr:LppX_LprAFG lipoprotein [Cellulosilyticum sp.]
MFKKSRLLVTGLLGLSMFFTGCGANEKENAKDVLKSASAKMSEAESYEMNMTMSMNIAQGEENLNMDMETAAKCVLKPELALQMDSAIDMTIAGESQNITMQQYVVKEDSQYTLYTGTMGIWGKTPMAGLEEAEAMLQDPNASLEKYLETIEDISFSGEKTVNGIDCKEIKVNLTKEYFNEVLDNADMLNTMGMDETSLNTTLDAINGVENLPVYYYVGKNSGELVGCNMDMSDLMKKVVLATTGESEDSVSELKVVMDMTFGNMNGVSEITLPEEAKSAVEMNLPQ